jgi:oligoribonuclease NrnB/cAMP/cGMP phosphodiesterase (DHH superfamily)
MSRPLVIYHANCLDGFGAAFAAHEHFRRGDACDCDFLPAAHGDAPPDCAGREVYVVDFAYGRRVMEQILDRAASVTVLDHHITAETDLRGLDEAYRRLKLVFSAEHSGAVVAWEFFHDTPPPLLLRCIEDRDLWRFELPQSRDVTAAMMSYPFDFTLWRDWAASPEAIEQLAQEGGAINRYRQQMVDHYRRRAVPGRIAGHTIPIVNCPREIVSELLGTLAEGQPFAAGYLDGEERRGWSLRSAADGLDVAAIAERFGGGGHRHAAGFSTPLPAGARELIPGEPD